MCNLIVPRDIVDGFKFCLNNFKTNILLMCNIIHKCKFYNAFLKYVLNNLKYVREEKAKAHKVLKNIKFLILF